MGLVERLNNTIKQQQPKNGQADHAQFKRFVQIYLINGDKILLKKNSALAQRNKMLYDVAIQGAVEKDENFLTAATRLFKTCTGQVLKFEDNNQDETRCVYTPKVFVDTAKKEIHYIYFIRYDATPTKAYVEHKSVESLEFVNVDKFVKIFFSKKHAKYSDTYTEAVRITLCEIFDIGNVKKENRYHRKVN